MKYIKLYEFFVGNIENFDWIEDPRYEYIIRWYACQVDDKGRYNDIELDIPIDIWYNYREEHESFTKEKPEVKSEDNRHFDRITSMWMSLKDQNFRRWKDAPYFIIEVEGDKSDKPARSSHGENKERLIIRDRKDNELIIDAMYKYMYEEHGDIYMAHKYNL